jgi:SAM-dependent methyltransferase
MPQDAHSWFADETFWRSSYAYMFPESRLGAAATEVEQILALAGRPEGPVLDLACGPGRHSVALAQRGFAVTAVDRSPFLLGKARSRGAAAGVAVEWLEQDMREFRRPDSFDLALSLFTSFGYFREERENQRVLENVWASLRTGGSFVLDLLGKEVLARIFTPTGASEGPDGVLIQRRRVVEGWSRIENEWILLQDGTSRTSRFDHWLYSGREIQLMLARAGFSDTRLFGDYLGAAYGPEAKRLVAVGRK